MDLPEGLVDAHPGDPESACFSWQCLPEAGGMVTGVKNKANKYSHLPKHKQGRVAPTAVHHLGQANRSPWVGLEAEGTGNQG